MNDWAIAALCIGFVAGALVGLFGDAGVRRWANRRRVEQEKLEFQKRVSEPEPRKFAIKTRKAAEGQTHRSRVKTAHFSKDRRYK